MKIISLLLFLTLTAQAQQKPADPKMKPYIDGLLAKMTQEEKIGQLNLVST